ncbi:MAG: hypothetical protein HY660_08910, partial [Armatimonadetes bacterium]|nr:hypothetical protein [Armatimonadota bacterium]
MAVDVRIQHGLQPVTQARALQTLLAVNAILPLPIESMLARIDEELQANPALDRETYPCAQCGHPVEGVVCGRCGHSVLSGTARFRGEGRATASRADGEEFDPLSQATRPPSLIEHLEHALAAHLKNPEDLRIGEYLIGCLDSRGYFDGDVNYAAADLDVPVAALERVLKQIQSLDPPGVGARSLQECLLIQLQGLAPSPIRTVATRIIADHLAEVARERHAVVAEALGIAVAEVREALAFMRRNLSPSPAEQFAAEHGGNTLRPEEVALPDVILTRTETGYKIEINGAGALTLRLNPFYRQALARTD